MVTEFKCKEDGCEEMVEYERRVLMALTTARTPEAEMPKIRIVYLTCSRGHTHSYRVETS